MTDGFYTDFSLSKRFVVYALLGFIIFKIVMGYSVILMLQRTPHLY